MPASPFDLTAQTKAAGDQLLTLVSQTQQAALASVKTLSSLAGPLTEKLPAMPFAPATADMKSMLDGGFALITSLIESQKAFTGELIDAITPTKA